MARVNLSRSEHSIFNSTATDKKQKDQLGSGAERHVDCSDNSSSPVSSNCPGFPRPSQLCRRLLRRLFWCLLALLSIPRSRLRKWRRGAMAVTTEGILAGLQRHPSADGHFEARKLVFGRHQHAGGCHVRCPPTTMVVQARRFGHC